ncbi:hypothetical protein [Haloarcula amylovorans]|uniref:hypothetical protein n=1 Tax=Haloarcula amylovorans TaxID=2562280 RepID=UPI001076B84D|nr:hypothetical protein [Halomicroarcula amylolytica]
MANDNTNTTSNFGIEYPTTGYNGTPTWADLYGSAFEDVDSALADRLIEEEVEDVVDALLAGGDKVSVSYDDANDALTIDTSALDAEEVRDEVGSLLVGGDGITATVDDAGDSVTIALAAHASTHEKGGSDELTTFGDTTHDSVTTEQASIVPDYIIEDDGGNYKAYSNTGLSYYEDTDIHALINTITSNHGHRRHIHITPSDQEYVYSTTLNITGTGLTLTGAGMDNTVLQQAPSANIDAVQYGPVESDTFFITFKHLTYYGNKSSNSSGSWLVTDNSGSAKPKDLHADHVFIKYYPEHGMVLDQTHGYRFISSLIEYCDGDAIRLDAASGSALNQMHLKNVYLAVNGGWGVNVVNAVDSSNIVDMVWDFVVRRNDAGGIHMGTADWYRNHLSGSLDKNGGSSGNNFELGGFTVSSANVIDITTSNAGGYGLSVIGPSNENEIRVIGRNNGSGLLDRAGYRNIINGVSINSGDPSSTGGWNGMSDLVYQLGCLVYDEANDSWYLPLAPTATNDWFQISGSAK